jgi:hypothetical protein
MGSFSRLTACERAVRFRFLAQQVKSEATLSRGHEQQEFIKIADAWERLALLAEVESNEIERTRSAAALETRLPDGDATSVRRFNRL